MTKTVIKLPTIAVDAMGDADPAVVLTAAQIAAQNDLFVLVTTMDDGQHIGTIELHDGDPEIAYIVVITGYRGRPAIVHLDEITGLVLADDDLNSENND